MMAIKISRTSVEKRNSEKKLSQTTKSNRRLVLFYVLVFTVIVSFSQILFSKSMIITSPDSMFVESIQNLSRQGDAKKFPPDCSKFPLPTPLGEGVYKNSTAKPLLVPSYPGSGAELFRLLIYTMTGGLGGHEIYDKGKDSCL